MNFCKKVKIPILGIVENMSGFVCPNCKTETKIFPNTNGGGEMLSKLFNVPFLGKIPLDPLVMDSCEKGQSIIAEAPESPTSKALSNVIQKLQKILVSKSK